LEFLAPRIDYNVRLAFNSTTIKEAKMDWARPSKNSK